MTNAQTDPLLVCCCSLCIDLSSFAWVFALFIIAICHRRVTFSSGAKK